jgi:hypothetical protein
MLRAHHVDAFISKRREEGVGENTINKELRAPRHRDHLDRRIVITETRPS